MARRKRLREGPDPEGLALLQCSQILKKRRNCRSRYGSSWVERRRLGKDECKRVLDYLRIRFVEDNHN